MAASHEGLQNVYQVKNNKPFYPYTNPEILVKIGLLNSEKQVLECRPLKNTKIKRKH